jgi:membrane protease YdiL (CAAX protease family)
VAPLVGGAALLVIAVSVLGWWRPVLFEVRRAKPRWLFIGPLFMVIGGIASLSVKHYSNTTIKMFWLLVAGSLLVGFCEETASRGVLVVGFRGAYSEPKVWFLSSLLFGLLHLPNWAFGAGPGAVFQVVLAFSSGSMLYLTRRLTGSLVPAMLLHGFWDFAAFLGKGGGAIPGLFAAANALLGIVLVLVLLRRERHQMTPQLGVPEPAVVA